MGAKAGDERTVDGHASPTTTAPSHLAGKAAQFAVTVKEIKAQGPARARRRLRLRRRRLRHARRAARGHHAPSCARPTRRASRPSSARPCSTRSSSDAPGRGARRRWSTPAPRSCGSACCTRSATRASPRRPTCGSPAETRRRSSRRPSPTPSRRCAARPSSPRSSRPRASSRPTATSSTRCRRPPRASGTTPEKLRDQPREGRPPGRRCARTSPSAPAIDLLAESADADLRRAGPGARQAVDAGADKAATSAPRDGSGRPARGISARPPSNAARNRPTARRTAGRSVARLPRQQERTRRRENEARTMSPLVPMVVEQTSRGERAFDIYSPPAQRAHRLPGDARGRPDRQPDRRPAPAPGVRGSRQGHLALHQLAGRLGLRRPRDLRHDAVHQARRADDLRRHRDVDGRAAAGRRRGGQAHGAAQREDPHPPGVAPASRARRRTSRSTPRRSSTSASAWTTSSPSTPGRTYDKVRTDTERDYFMSSEEAKEYGIIDRVISEH